MKSLLESKFAVALILAAGALGVIVGVLAEYAGAAVALGVATGALGVLGALIYWRLRVSQASLARTSVRITKRIEVMAAESARISQKLDRMHTGQDSLRRAIDASGARTTTDLSSQLGMLHARCEQIEQTLVVQRELLAEAVVAADLGSDAASRLDKLVG